MNDRPNLQARAATCCVVEDDDDEERLVILARKKFTVDTRLAALSNILHEAACSVG